MILRPLAARLGTHRLLIVCDGMLQFVPFAALPEPDGSAPLVARHEVVMLPSASALAEIGRRTARRPAATTVAVLADPVYEADDPRIQARPSVVPASEGVPPNPLGLGRLPFSKAEGESILHLVHASQRSGAFGFLATREAALARLRDSRIVHFAAHAVPDTLRPELSSIVLSLYDTAGRARDGLLRLHDVYDNLGLVRADLVVLSACETTIGKDVPGEGVMGLARGFLAAGAGAVIASLYTVQDEPTMELMKALYAELLGAQRLSAPAALRAAQLQMLAHPRFKDPHFWAAFVATGKYDG
jgi:CHAT domain-containing protein